MKASRWLSVLGASMLLVLAGCDWAQYGADATHSGYNPNESVITVGNVNTLTPVWRSRNTGAVIAVGASVFATRSGASGIVLVALDAATGAMRWQTAPAGTQEDLSGPVVSGNNVYVELWNFADQTVSLHAYDTGSGTLRFASSPSATPLGCREPSSGLTVDSGIVAVLDSSGSVCAFDASTGAFKWRTPLVGAEVGGVAIAGGRVFAAGGPSGANIEALDPTNGALLWSKTVTNPGGAVGVPVVSGPRLFVPAGRLLTFDTTTGAPGWTGTAKDVSVGGGFVVAVADDVVRALDPSTGAERWSIVGPLGTHYSKPAIANGVVFLGSNQVNGDPRAPNYCCAHISTLRLDNGGLLSSIPIAPDVALPGAIVSNGTAYVDSFDLTALRPSGTHT